MGKQGIKKTKINQQEYIQRKQNEQEIYTARAFMYSHQDTMDAFVLAMNELGFGKDRLKKYIDKIEEKFYDIRMLESEDTKDCEYSREVIERNLQRALQEYYTPFNERYAVTIKDKNGVIHYFSKEAL